MTRVVASIEARMSSSRLPGKILMDVCGEPALGRLVSRLRRARRLDDIVVATTQSAADDAVETWARSFGVHVHRGSEDDVLARVTEAQQSLRSDLTVEVTGDCTLIDPEIIDLGIETFLENDCDVVANVRKSSYPMGIDVQVFRTADLGWVARNITDAAVREHVSLYFYENPQRYRLIHLMAPTRWRAPEYRFQLDYAEDLQFIRTIYERLTPRFGDGFGLDEIMRLLAEEPALLDINRHCVEKSAR